VIAMTAHAMLGDRERFLEAGMSDYIAKPIEEKQLLSVLSRWLEQTATVAEAHAASAATPEILPGLMVGDGIRRASGNESLYRSLLGELRRELDASLPRLRTLIDGNESNAAKDLLHTLKGSAATLGARRVAEISAALEAKLRSGDAIALDELNEAADEVRRSIEAYLARGTTDTAVPAPVSGPKLHPIVRKMDEHLRANNLAAVACFDELKSLGAGRFGEPMRQLQASLDRLDFETARTHLHAIETQIAAEESA